MAPDPSVNPAVNLASLFRGLDPQYLGCGPDTRVSGLETDSRCVKPGQVFVAIAGATVDGHRFVDEALRGNAAVAVVQRGRFPDLAGPHVRLADTSAALPYLAARAYGEAASQLILGGLTGTNGKTTVAFLVGSILRAAGVGHIRLGSTGHWIVDTEVPAAYTTPFPAQLHRLLRRGVASGGTHGVMEVSSHALDQGRIEGLNYAGVALTSFSQDHLDYHGTLRAYLAAKCRLPAAHLRPGGWVIASTQAGEYGAAFLEAGRRAGGRPCLVSTEVGAKAEIRVKNRVQTAAGTELCVEAPGGMLSISSPLVGGFNVENLMVAVAMGLSLGIDLDRIHRGLSGARGAPGRMERVCVEGIVGPTVLVDYAHTPDAVRRVIQAVRPMTSGRLIVVLGCGGDRDRAKRATMGEIASTLADRLVATSDNPRSEDPDRILDEMLSSVPVGAVTREVDRRLAIRLAIGGARPGDTVIVAGKGHETYQLVGASKLEFDDRAEARAALRCGHASRPV
ncbi:MAG: UDP-N-acetylmuramoyl-L-alanyl-D-glutamate--2,6-diaminopimelate ligase [Nannocystaceae bacterium]